MYKDVRNCNIVLSGVNDPYDIPKEPDIVLETDKYSAECIG